MLYTLVGVVATMIAGYISSLFFPPPQADKIESLLWRQVVLNTLRRENKERTA